MLLLSDIGQTFVKMLTSCRHRVSSRVLGQGSLLSCGVKDKGSPTIVAVIVVTSWQYYIQYDIHYYVQYDIQYDIQYD